ncbi:MAG: hypothetical protein DMG15_15575 [Acidobacteria bacterium]|nr:MAG: hypothetical protein DMG15_15575 [Acidobacteriota bacterium]
MFVLISIDGHEIAIDVDRDTVEGLIGEMNGANAGITASYDPLSDRLNLQATAIGPDLIDVTADSTGFLSAAGLDSNNTIRGRLADNQNVVSNLSQFAGVANGSFNINGVSIDVDASHDTLQSLIAKINASAAGVTAGYDAETDRLVLTSNNGTPVSVGSDTSGFLTAAKVSRKINPNAAFNGSGANAALFDPGKSVRAGSFKVNGVRIEVAADDSIASVVAKITSSSAGVTAAFDETAQTIKLTSKDKTGRAIAVITIAMCCLTNLGALHGDCGHRLPVVAAA